MITTVFSSFKDIEKDLEREAPKIVYKYRTWKDPYHKRLLINQEAWFSHPFDLNDPLDVRPETEFDLEEIQDSRYLEKLRLHATQRFPSLSSQDQDVKALEQWELTKNNPSIIIENHKQQIQEKKKYDRVGVFSTSSTELSPELWTEYGDMHQGYCLGFKTVSFCAQVKSSYGYVYYSDKPYRYSFLQKNDEFNQLYLKKTSWQYENEFRFITVGVGIIADGKVYSERAQKFHTDIVE